MADKRRGAAVFSLLIAVAALAFVIDVVTKVAVLAHLTVGEPVPLIGGILALNLIFNPGAAFSFAGGMTWVFSIIALAVVIGIIWTARRLRSYGWAVALGLLLGGTLGNLADRIFPKAGAPQDRAFGQGVVVDFLHLNYFAIFNMADVFITCAVVVLLLLVLRGIGIDGKRSDKGGVEGSEPDGVDAAGTAASSPVEGGQTTDGTHVVDVQDATVTESFAPPKHPQDR